MMRKIIFLLIGILLISPTFAVDSISPLSDPSFWQGLANFLNIIWLPLAVLAGKLFTNEFVYGTFIHIDQLLREVWNTIRTFSNYAIGFILIISIFGLLIGKVKNIFSIFAKLAIASILINASWFLIGVLIDISTVLMLAVGAFPLKILNDSNYAIPPIKLCEKIELSTNFKTNNSQIVKCDKSVSVNDMNSFFQHMNNISGPLVYLGAGILNIDKNWYKIDENASKVNTAKVVSIALILKLVVLGLFVVPLFVLVIIGVIRIFWIWVWVAFSPLIILDQIFGGKIGKSRKEFQLSNIIGLIFQPVLIMFVMGIVLVFINSLYQVFKPGNNDTQALQTLGICKDDKSSFCINNQKVLSIQGNLMQDFIKNVGGAFGFIIFVILIAMVMWSMLKFVSLSSEITKGVVNNIYEFATESFKAVPIVPIGKGVGIGAIETALSKGILKKGFADKTSQQAERLLEALHIKPNDIGISDKTHWEEEFSTVKSFESWRNELVKFISQTIEKNPDLIPVYAPNFKEVLYDALDKAYKKKLISESDLKDIGFLKEKDGKYVKVSMAQLFLDEKKFHPFLNGLIKYSVNPRGLEGDNTFNNWYNKIVGLGSSRVVTDSISKIAGKN